MLAPLVNLDAGFRQRRGSWTQRISRLTPGVVGKSSIPRERRRDGQISNRNTVRLEFGLSH